MAIIKEVTVKINNGTATLDAPVQFYEKDHDVELRFKLMDYKYKYDKDPQNILNSVDEDVLEAYTTIVNPIGYELEQINGVVENDTVIFRLDPTYTDELEELGTYKLQIHIKCTHSEFTIPPITFEVLQRLKGIKVVTDGEDEVDNSEILDNSSKFVSDETGKLIIEWKKGDMISSAKLNAMVDVINDAVDEEVIRQANEIERQQKVDASISDYETRFNALTVSRQQDAEVIDARDGEQTLRARLDRDIQKPLIIYEEVEDSYISCDTTEGYAQNVEILGNTIQNQNDLADIRSVGDDVEGQELYGIDIVSCGKNLLPPFESWTLEGNTRLSGKNEVTQIQTNAYQDRIISPYISVDSSKSYSLSKLPARLDEYLFQLQLLEFDKNLKQIGSIRYIDNPRISILNECTKYIKINFNTGMNLSGTYVYKDIQLEEGTVATEYEPYQEDKLTILSPVQLEKVGDVADRIVCKDGVWGVEKNIKTITYTDDIDWSVSGQSLCMNPNLDFDKSISNADIVMSMLLSNQIVQREHHLYNGIYYGIGYKPATDTIRVRLEGINSKEELNTYIKTNPIVLKYQTAQPQFIPLPHDQQIKLRTFAGKTNIHFLTEIEPTLKASVPKSIGATVSTHTEQIDNLGKELDKVKKIEESTVSTVTTESDFTTVENTSNGYFEDVKLEGRTLVNLYPKLDAENYSSLDATLSNDTITIDANGRWKNFMIKKDVMPLKASTYYTFVIDIIENTLEGNDNFPLHFGETFESEPSKFSDEYLPFIQNKKGIYTFKLKTKDSFDNINNDTRDFLSNTVTSGTIVFKYMILEGDHTQNPPEYFEGLKSVGQDVDKVNITTSNNLFNDNDITINMSLGGYSNAMGLLSPSDYTHTSNYIPVFANNEYIFIYEYETLSNTRKRGYVFYDEFKNIIPAVSSVDQLYDPAQKKHIFVSKIDGYLRIGYDVNCKNIRVVSKQDKKRILYYNPTTQTWEKPVLREWDSIEKHSDGKYYYHKRSKEMVLNGSEDWGESGVDHSKKDMMRFYINTDAMPTPYKVAGPIISDKFATSSFDAMYDQNTEGVSITIDSELGLGIFKSRLSTVGVVGLKAWLQANPTTVVYQLKTEEVYECINIDLMTYENETNFIVNTGPIVPLSTLKVMCNITNVVRELQQKVSNLENYIQHVMIDALNNALNE